MTRRLPPAPLAENLASKWMLRADVHFLNHGSFGAVPREVFECHQTWRARIEAEPVELLGRRHGELVRGAKQTIGDWLKMRPDDFGLVTNATEGVNAVLRSLHFDAGDELLTTNHVYNAVRQAMRYFAQRCGGLYREIPLPTPIPGPENVVAAISNALTPRTRLVVIDHVTSPTALVFPVCRIIEVCAARGVEVLVDGAHAPGMIDLDVPSLGAAYYAGNLHKWACCPKGCGFLWVDPRRQQQIHSCVISHYLGEGLAKEFEWQGTRDAAAWFSIPEGIGFMSKLGWEAVQEHNRALAAWAGEMLCAGWGGQPLGPRNDSMLGAMVTVRLPDPVSQLNEVEGRRLQQSLYDEDRIEAPLIFWQGQWHARISCQVYNRPDQYCALAKAMERRAKRL